MTLTQPLRLMGAPGSPYTRKMLAYLRYRRISYEFMLGDRVTDLDLPRPKVELLPTFYLSNDEGEIEAVVDSTPLIRRFEQAFPGREAVPSDPALAFINYLVEDYADEWLTKPMFTIAGTTTLTSRKPEASCPSGMACRWTQNSIRSFHPLSLTDRYRAFTW